MTLDAKCYLLMVSAAGLVGCFEGQHFESGEDEPLLIERATFVAAPLPVGRDGPEVVSATFTTRFFPFATQDKPFKGVLGEGATAVMLGLLPENGVPTRGHWLLPASAPAVENPRFPTFSASLSFGENLLPGTYVLALSAANEDGAPGALKSIQFEMREPGVVEGDLVFSLDWSTDADLDIHVQTPRGDEIYRDDVRESAASESADLEILGHLDFDSNGDCHIDGRRNENVIWPSKPPTGRYIVKVDTFSMCDQVQTYWRVTAQYRGKLVAATTGVSLPSDTRWEHGRGSGLVAMEVTVD